MSEFERGKPASSHEPSHDPSGAARPQGAGDPSMEDILASIRRILAEEEAPPPHVAPAPVDSVLQLEASMMVADTPPAPPAPAPVIAPVDTAAAAVIPAHAAPLPEPGGMPAFGGPPLGVPSTLVAPEAAAAAATSMGSLVRTLMAERGTQVHSGGPTIEDMVRAELRPLLKGWLDDHLPLLVERLVRAEIERVVGRSVP
jgi:cell pole-organizing protein PopZ